MKIEFCKRWIELRGADGFVVWAADRVAPLPWVGEPPAARCVDVRGRDNVWGLTPRGADLVASYEAAVSMGEVKPDDAPEPAFKAGDLVRIRPEYRRKFGKVPDGPLTILGPDGDGAWNIGSRARDYAMTEELQLVVYEPCPDCEFGRVSIPGLMSIVPVDPDNEITQTMRCPACKGAKVVEVETVRDIGRPLAGLTEAKRAFLIAGTDGWQPLTHELAATLTGKRIEVQNARRRLFGQGKQTTALGISDCGKWIRVDVGASLSECYPLSRGWSVRVIDEAWITEPAAMMALLEEARLEGFEVEVRAESEDGSGSMETLGRFGTVNTTDKSEMPVEINGVWCAIDGRVTEYGVMYGGTFSPVLTAVRRAKTGGRHGDA